MHSFEHDDGASRTVFGVGTLSRVGPELARLGGRRALVLSTPGQRGLAQRLAEVLGDAANTSVNSASTTVALLARIAGPLWRTATRRAAR